MEGNEMNVFVHSHSEDSEKDENSISENVTKQNKSGFRHFVEESTLRNISLDELEELSDTGCSGADGIIRRTPSSVSSEQAVRYAIILKWHGSYFTKTEGLLRFILVILTALSLAFVSIAGDNEIDVLELPFSSSIRAHIFVSVFSLLVASTFLILEITMLIESFPLYWNVIDAALHGSICSLFIFSSAMLLHSENHFRYNEPLISEWTTVKITLSAAFGFLCTIVCAFLTVMRSCASKTHAVPEDIVLTSLRSS